MKPCVVCELPVRLTEVEPGTTEDEEVRSGVSATALASVVDMMGGHRNLVTTVEKLVPEMGTRRLLLDESATFTFNFSPDNPFSNSMYAARESVGKCSMFLYNHNTGKVEDPLCRDRFLCAPRTGILIHFANSGLQALHHGFCDCAPRTGILIKN